MVLLEGEPGLALLIGPRGLCVGAHEARTGIGRVACALGIFSNQSSSGQDLPARFIIFIYLFSGFPV